jgi:hypothetical protein
VRPISGALRERDVPGKNANIAVTSAETAAMLLWALLAAGQITMRKVDGRQTLDQNLADQPIDLVPNLIFSSNRK